MKRESLWSVTLNADKRAIETKGKTSSSAFNALFKNLEMCCLSLRWVLQVLLIFFSWSWIKWGWICRNITTYSFADVWTLHDCFLRAQRKFPVHQCSAAARHSACMSWLMKEAQKATPPAWRASVWPCVPGAGLGHWLVQGVFATKARSSLRDRFAWWDWHHCLRKFIYTESCLI